MGFKFDSIKLREVSKLIGDLNISSIIGAGSLVALGEGIKKLIESSSSLSSNLLTLQANTGIDLGFAQQFEDASKALGSSKEAAEGLITSLSKIRNDVAMGKGIPVGLQLLGYNEQDFQGTIEDTIKMINERLSKALPENATKPQKEHFAGFVSSLAQSLGASPDMLKPLINPDLFKIMDKFLVLTKDDVKENQQATLQWSIAVENVNTEFKMMATHFLPPIIDILKNFNEGGGFKEFAKDVEFIAKWFDRWVTALGIIKNYTNAGLLNLGSFASQPLIAATKFHNEMSHAASMAPMNFSQIMAGIKEALGIHAKPSQVTISVAPITIHANDPQEFVKKFDDHFKKYMELASSQFTLGQV